MLSVKLADSRLEKMKVTLFAVLVTLFAASVAAKKNPVLAEDFSAEVKVELHTDDGKLLFGDGILVRDGMHKAFQRSVLRSQMNFRLDRYDLGVEYYFRGNKSEYHCSNISPNRTKLFPFWDWLPYATFIGINEVEHRKMAQYENEVSGVRFVLGVDPNNATCPLSLERRSEFQQVIFTFDTFNKYNEKTDGKFFEVPDQCKPSV